jgi:hypothetical protein
VRGLDVARQASVSPSGRSRPDSASVTYSRIEVVSVVTTAAPHADASSVTLEPVG